MDNQGENKRFDSITTQGISGGLFEQCMKKVRSQHSVSKTLRNALIVSGLLTDRACYAEFLVQFYVCSKALVLPEGLEFLAKYKFIEGYESDLEILLGPDWRTEVDTMTLPISQEYARKIEQGSNAFKYAAAAILFGVLVIGGGAAIESRVRRNFSCGDLFKFVIGSGRADRRREFIESFDAVAGPDDPIFEEIVAAAGECMGYNNKLLAALQRRPYWYYPALVGGVCVAISAGALFWKKYQK